MMRGVLVPGTVALPGGPDAVFAGVREAVFAAGADELFAGGADAVLPTQPAAEAGDAVSTARPVFGSTRRGLGITEPGGVAVKTLPGWVDPAPTGPCGPAAEPPGAGATVPGAAVDPPAEPGAAAGAPAAPLPAPCAYSGAVESNIAATKAGVRRCFIAASLRGSS
jgi:hypothetical protein